MLRLSVTKTKFWQRNTPGTLDKKSPLWRKLRQDALQRDNYTCRFCDVRSAKYMICDHIDRNPSHNDLVNLGICCSLCDSIRHCGQAGILDLLSLGISRMPQKDINLRTLQLFSETHKVPLCSDVDSSAVIIADSTVDYANILLTLDESFDYSSKCYCSPLPHTYDMHKGFFKQDSASRFREILENRF
ncbi:hypothetical protein BG011_002190 [Mortierella polycephala]|uniref:HNH nuclease domain-containing protein n=1 Tax=Mortierella polycephala TaxID=41804 RepID=A0A9P6U550_9FUNG|nr:hypothetical protein BG011_002190 [Mortierella polycephala]